ncbi:MAG: hypothetical protein MUC85_05770 [Anaerolineales bacterium]|jgi:hypothetical protein|nr:hypothetical protein [Anaerolineales bacterium]
MASEFLDLKRARCSADFLAASRQPGHKRNLRRIASHRVRLRVPVAALLRSLYGAKTILFVKDVLELRNRIHSVRLIFNKC